MFPIVTGIRLAVRKCAHEMSAPAKIPKGTKYMFATLCSKPQATNAAIGGTIARILSPVDRAP
jgi:hypothetical protein